MFYLFTSLALNPEGLQHFLRVLAHWRQLVDVGTTFKKVEFVGRHQQVRSDPVALEITDLEALNSPIGSFVSDKCLQGFDVRFLVDFNAEFW
jgi:hypothetical protein